MKKINIIICTLILISCFGQAGIVFKKYELPNIGYISIPSNMELQDKNITGNFYPKDMPKYQINDAIVFQQKGLNDFSKNSFNTYARIITETSIGNFGDYDKLNTHYTMNTQELNLLDKHLKSQIEQMFNHSSHLKLMESWH